MFHGALVPFAERRKIRMKAIIYTSNTGSTAEYAQLLGKELNLPVHKVRRYILNRMNTTKKCRNIKIWN